ncbi:MAG: YcxB family protein [Ignavibacteriaceae bacterium]
MKINVQLNSKDFKLYNAAAIKFWSKKKKRKFNLVDAVLYVGLFFILLFYALGSCLNINWFHFLIGILVGIILLLMLLNEQKKILEPKENGMVYGPTAYEFTDKGIKVEKINSESFTKWEAVEKVFNTNEYFYIFLDHNLAYIIPKRYLLPSEKLNEFVALINQFIPGKILTK